MKRLICCFFISCSLCCLTSFASKVHHFNLLLFIDRKIIIDETKMDFILIDSLSNKRDTIECKYNVGDLRIKDVDLEKIKDADSVYVHIIAKNADYQCFDYDIACSKYFKELNFYIIQIFNRNKHGTKYDYGYYGHSDNGKEDNYVVSGYFSANPHRKKYFKYFIDLINF